MFAIHVLRLIRGHLCPVHAARDERGPCAKHTGSYHLPVSRPTQLHFYC